MNKNTKMRRRLAGIVALAVATALVMTGTFAWQSISQKAVNNTKWETKEAGARLHDDFADNQEWTLGANQDVYVENFSGQNPKDSDDEGRAIYVRVRLSEYMEIGEGAGLFNYPKGADSEDYQSLDQAGNGGVRTADPDNKAQPVIAGSSITDISTWQVHIPGTSVDDDGSAIDDYWKWSMGGKKVFMPTFNKNKDNLLTDRTKYAQDEFQEGDTLTNSTSYADPAYDQRSETHTARFTQDTADVMDMHWWWLFARPFEDYYGSGYWVGDTDGWFYWSKALLPGEATGLLLDKKTMVNKPEGESYYAVHVTAQSATAGDWGDEDARTGFYKDGLTDDALVLLEQAAENEITYAQGETFQDENDIKWRVLTEENGHKLIMTEYIYGFGTPYNTTNIWTPLDASGNALKAALQSFYSERVGDDVKDLVVPYESLTDIRSEPGGLDIEEENAEAGWSKPGSGTVTANGSNAVFVLSISEANKYFGDDAARRATVESPSGMEASWWLRSPGDESSWPTLSMGPYLVGFYPEKANTDQAGFRLALWVKSQ